MSYQISNRLAGAAAAALLGAALLAAPIGATAQTPAAPMAAPAAPSTGTAPSATKRSRPRADRVETRIKQLHAELKITPDQETEWNAVAEAMRDNAHEMDSLGQQRTKSASTMNAVENLKSYEAMVDAHADGLKKLVPAIQALYDKMSDDQKKNADAIFSRQRSTRRHTPPKAG